MKCVQKYCKLTLLSLVLAMSLNPEQVAANNNTPIAIINLSGNSTTVSPGIPITFDGTQSYDPDNTNIIAYNWWYVDGVVHSQGSTADKKMFSYNFTLPAGVNSKTFQIKLTVRDNEYTTASKTITVTVHNGIAQTEYYLTDHLGSIRTTIDQNGTVIGFDDYDPFGNVLPGRSSNLGTPNDLNKFTGHERDQEGGLDLDYMLARNYDSELGRFYSVDPLYNKFPAWSPYNYTMNNPLRLIDPDGKAAEDPYLYFNRNEQRVYIMEDNDTPEDFTDDFQIGDPILAHNKVATNSKGIWPDGTDFVKKEDQLTPKKHGGRKDNKGIKLDSDNGSYGEGGIIRVNDFVQDDGEVRSGMGVHEGREDKPFFNRLTNGCIRLEKGGLAKIIQAIEQYGPLQMIIIDSNKREIVQ